MAGAGRARRRHRAHVELTVRVMQALLYLAAVLLLALAAVGLVARVPGALLGAACAVLAFSLPVVTAL